MARRRCAMKCRNALAEELDEELSGLDELDAVQNAGRNDHRATRRSDQARVMRGFERVTDLAREHVEKSPGSFFRQ
jgi:hypothetical protein